jgi:hypothetical protein
MYNVSIRSALNSLHRRKGGYFYDPISGRITFETGEMRLWKKIPRLQKGLISSLRRKNLAGSLTQIKGLMRLGALSQSKADRITYLVKSNRFSKALSIMF